MQTAHLRQTLEAAATAPSEVRIFQFGKIRTTKGEFLFDKKSAAAVLATWTDYGNDLCFDYEHKAVDPDARAGDGKAAGWFKLAIKDDGLYAVGIRWSDAAAKAIANREWRYFSPTFNYDEKSGRILELINVALTNIPATKNLPALIAAHRKSKRNAMTIEEKKAAKRAELAAAKKAKKLDDDDAPDAAMDDGEDLDDADPDAAMDGEDLDDDSPDAAMDDDMELADDDADVAAADDDAPPAAAKKVAKKAGKQTSRISASDMRIIAVAREITGRTDASEVVGSLRAHKSSQVELTRLSKEVSDLKRLQVRTFVKHLVEKAIKAGKITPAQRDMFAKIGLRDRRELKALLETMPTRVQMRDNDAHEPSSSQGSLSRLEREVATKLGTIDLYTKAKSEGRVIDFFAQTEEDKDN